MKRITPETSVGSDEIFHFRPTKIGRYQVTCAQLCGDGHARMKGAIRVVDEAEWNEWYKAEKEKKNPDKKLIKKLEEGKMKELHGYIQQGKTADWIAKKMKLDVKTIKALIGACADSRFISGSYSEGAAADARRAMRADPDMLQRGFS